VPLCSNESRQCRPRSPGQQTAHWTSEDLDESRACHSKKDTRGISAKVRQAVAAARLGCSVVRAIFALGDCFCNRRPKQYGSSKSLSDSPRVQLAAKSRLVSLVMFLRCDRKPIDLHVSVCVPSSSAGQTVLCRSAWNASCRGCSSDVIFGVFVVGRIYAEKLLSGSDCRPTAKATDAKHARRTPELAPTVPVAKDDEL
jgi:hypothetical protein